MKRCGGRLRLSGKIITLTVRDANQIIDEIGELERVAPFEEKRMTAKFRNNSKDDEKVSNTALPRVVFCERVLEPTKKGVRPLTMDKPLFVCE